MAKKIVQALKKFVPLSVKRAWNGRKKLEPILYPRPGSFRIAIKSPVPSDTNPEQWGDYHFAKALGDAFFKLGCSVRIDFADSWYESDGGDNAVIVLRGTKRYKPSPKDLNIMWNISHPSKVTMKEMSEYDHVFTAGSRAGCELLHQCSNPNIFNVRYDGPYLERPIFVGNARGETRKIVQDCIDIGFPIDVHGRGWEGRIPSEMIASEYLPNEKLGTWYSAAPVVLSDQYQDMSDFGYIPNRVFDAYACGTTVISAPWRGTTELFEDSVLTYSSKDELRFYLNMFGTRPYVPHRKSPSPHTFDARACVILKRIEDLNCNRIL